MYGADRLHEEVAYIAFHLHWSLDAVLDLEHADRRRFVHETARITQRTPPGR